MLVFSRRDFSDSGSFAESRAHRISASLIETMSAHAKAFLIRAKSVMGGFLSVMLPCFLLVDIIRML